MKLSLDAICRLTVLPEWTDYNGHMNVAYYALAFDQAVDVFFEESLGMSEQSIKSMGAGPFALQSSYCYLAELMEGEAFDFSIRVLDFDEKRMHFFGRMRRLRDGESAATVETLYMHVDHEQRRAAPYPDEIFERIAAAHRKTADLPWPDESGRSIGIRRKRC